MYNIYVGCLNGQYNISNDHVVSIVSGLMALFCSLRSYKETKKAVAYLIQIPYRTLRVGTPDVIEDKLRVISAILKHCNLDSLQFQLMMSGDRHLSIKLLVKLWPQFISILDLYGDNPVIIDCIAECIEAVMSECPDDYAQSKLFESVLRDERLRVQLVDAYLRTFPDDHVIVDTLLEQVTQLVENEPTQLNQTTEKMMGTVFVHSPLRCQEWMVREDKMDLMDTFRAASSKQHLESMENEWCSDCDCGNLSDASYSNSCSTCIEPEVDKETQVVIEPF